MEELVSARTFFSLASGAGSFFKAVHAFLFSYFCCVMVFFYCNSFAGNFFLKCSTPPLNDQMVRPLLAILIRVKRASTLLSPEADVSPKPQVHFMTQMHCCTIRNFTFLKFRDRATYFCFESWDSMILLVSSH